MFGSSLVIVLLAGAALALSGAARSLGRRIPGAHLCAFVLLVCLPFPRAFLGGGTPLPLDHVPLTHPWLPLGRARPYNAYLTAVVSQILPWPEAVRVAMVPLAEASNLGFEPPSRPRATGWRPGEGDSVESTI